MALRISFKNQFELNHQFQLYLRYKCLQNVLKLCGVDEGEKNVSIRNEKIRAGTCSNIYSFFSLPNTEISIQFRLHREHF